ncbi:MAG: hypothetical protein Solumvirus2_12 [Solumvirus sp.]|uniref:HNH domain-containing protein n=1 Tax=Solumvirus sp. TaxID=2487773 RepID=A0A3G5AG73_9VIRU|nr:MAG: hypothetical protein Solumvirus2_12 [Solumvirus sp.]
MGLCTSQSNQPPQVTSQASSGVGRSGDEEHYPEEIVGGGDHKGQSAGGKSTYHKKAIPQAVRRMCYITYLGHNFDGKCYCCDQPINPFEFEAGHVKAEREGGETKVENLRPICSLCNRSMGTINMKDFVFQHGMQGKIKNERSERTENTGVGTQGHIHINVSRQ